MCECVYMCISLLVLTLFLIALRICVHMEHKEPAYTHPCITCVQDSDGLSEGVSLFLKINLCWCNLV